MSKKEIDKLSFALTGGILGGLCTFVTTLLGMAGIFTEYAELSKSWLVAVYGFLGYSGFNFISGILGGFYSFIDCFILFWIFSYLYNFLVRYKN